MNSKIILRFFIVSSLLSCGVKGPPIAPAGTAIPSYSDEFLDLEAQKKEAQIEAAKEAEKKKANLPQSDSSSQ